MFSWFVLLFYMSSVPVTQNKRPNSHHSQLVQEFLVNVKCRMDGSHRKPYICLSFDFLIQYSTNGTCLTLVSMQKYVTSLSGFFELHLISLTYTETL